MKQTELTGTCRVCCRDMTQKETEAPARPVCPESEVILQADHLFFSYDQGRSCALRDLSLKIRRGSKTAFLGATGSEVDFFSAATAFTVPHPALCPLPESWWDTPEKNSYPSARRWESYFRIRTASSFPPAFTRRSPSES